MLLVTSRPPSDRRLRYTGGMHGPFAVVVPSTGTYAPVCVSQSQLVFRRRTTIPPEMSPRGTAADAPAANWDWPAAARVRPPGLPAPRRIRPPHEIATGAIGRSALSGAPQLVARREAISALVCCHGDCVLRREPQLDRIYLLPTPAFGAKRSRRSRSGYGRNGWPVAASSHHCTSVRIAAPVAFASVTTRFSAPSCQIGTSGLRFVLYQASQTRCQTRLVANCLPPIGSGGVKWVIVSPSSTT